MGYLKVETYINNSFKSNQCHTNRLGKEEEREDAFLADDGVEETLMDGDKGPQDCNNLPCIGITEHGWGVLHVVHILIDGIGDLDKP